VEPAPEAGRPQGLSGLEEPLQGSGCHPFSILRGGSTTGTLKTPQGHKGAPPRWGGRFFTSQPGGNVGKDWTTAKEVIDAISNVNLHSMTARESERLHAECRGILITIEEFWAKWDDPVAR